MATASALGEFNNYINKFWGATDIIVTYGTEAPFYPNQTLSKVLSDPLVRQTTQRLNWLGATGNSASNTTFFIVGVDPKTDFDYATFNITGSSRISFGEAVVDNILAQKYGLTVDSTFEIFTLTSQGNIRPIPLQVTGINYPLRNLGSSIYMYLPDLQSDLVLGGQITHIYASLYDSTKALLVENDLQKLLPLYDVSAPKAEAVQRISGQTAGFQIGLNVMIAISLVVCSFIVFNTLFMTVMERTYEIGIMRAVGSSRSQIFRIFLAEGLLIGALGTIAGILGGLGLARLFTSVFETTFNVPSLPVAELTPNIVITGLVAGFSAVFAGALYPAISASRINIIQAIRPSARNARRQLPLSGVSLTGIVLLGLGASESLRLTPFHIAYLDVILVPIGLILLGAVFFGRTGRAIMLLVFPASRTVRYVASRSGRRRLLRNTVSFGMIAITLSFAIMIGGIQSGVQEALQQGIQEALGADIILVANQLSILTRNSTVNNTNSTVPFTVAGVFTGPVLQYIQFGEHFASDSVVVSFVSQREYFAGRDTAPLFLVDLRSQYKSQAAGVARDITTMFPQYNFGENSLTLGELLSLVNSTINRIFALILLILYFALLIASLGIGATMIMSVSDRRREIGLLRSQGVSRLQITGLFLGEGTFLGLFGFLLAVPGGLLLLKGATNSTSLAGFFIPFIIPYGAIVQALILALAAVLTGSLYPAVRASRLEITRALEQV